VSAGIAGLTTERRLALVAAVLAAGALFADVAPDRQLRLHETELAVAIERSQDHVTPGELARWIVEGRADYRLLDLRDAEAFARYHIPTAENIPLASLPDAPLARNEKVVLYSDGASEGDLHAAQGWMLLRAAGHPATYALLGGMNAWKDEVLFPARPEGEDPGDADSPAFEAVAARARFFGGSPRDAGPAQATAAEPLPLPVVEAPAAPPARVAPRKKKEGC